MYLLYFPYKCMLPVHICLGLFIMHESKLKFQIDKNCWPWLPSHAASASRIMRSSPCLTVEAGPVHITLKAPREAAHDISLAGTELGPLGFMWWALFSQMLNTEKPRQPLKWAISQWLFFYLCTLKVQPFLDWGLALDRMYPDLLLEDPFSPSGIR